MSIEFESWPKTTRLFRQVTVTEKIDGTNACIIFEPCGEDCLNCTTLCCEAYEVGAQSRNRLISPDNDNAGFAAWVYENADQLFSILGYGRHYGEWWGQKIGRKYGMDHRVFSLFNVDKWSDELMDGVDIGDAKLSTVPVLYRGDMDTERIMYAARMLKLHGSVAAPGFMDPEGLCVWHSQSRIVQKFTFDNNDKGKWESL